MYILQRALLRPCSGALHCCLTTLSDNVNQWEKKATKELKGAAPSAATTPEVSA